jgi:hypothetical protein
LAATWAALRKNDYELTEEVEQEDTAGVVSMHILVAQCDEQEHVSA